jgi:DNA-binding winged helix-turn-helix (wHTH) protein
LRIAIAAGMLLVGSRPMSADAWEYDAELLLLRNAARTVRVTRKAGDVLACLMRHHGRVVSPEHLLREVWSGLNVSPALAREYVSDLRSLLGDDARAPRFIETVRGRGYRLFGDVRAAWAGVPATPVRIAVLGFVDHSFGACRTRAARDLSDSIAVELDRYPDVAIIVNRQAEDAAGLSEVARDSSKVRYLVTGSIVIQSDEFRALIELVEVATGRIGFVYRCREPAVEFPRQVKQVSVELANLISGLFAGMAWHERHTRPLACARQPSFALRFSSQPP